MSLRKALKERILIGDGAMGTLLYSHGIDRSFEEITLSHPEEIYHIHKAYIHAGADVIQTNTYGANVIKLSRYGLENKVKVINQEAVRIARKAAGRETFVLGTIGGILGFNKQEIPLNDITNSFKEQLYSLLEEGVDGLLLETYYDLEELTAVLAIARLETNLPIIAHVTMHEPGVLQNGLSLTQALTQLEGIGADVVGVNCRLGPHHMIRALESVPLQQKAFLSAYPNASLPDYEDGKLTYTAKEDYFKKCAIAFRNEGIRLLGGCCGTRPEHIKAFAEGIKGLRPLQEKVIKQKEKRKDIFIKPILQETPLFKKVMKERSIIVELDPPKHLNTNQFFAGAEALKKAGIDALTLADNSLASPRISNSAIAAILKKDFDLKPLVHITCRDRNLIGLQSHLMGLHTLGLNEVLAVTGDPTKIGDFPGATSVYDLTSFDLIRLIKQFNQGISFSGKSLKQKTDFRVAAAFNPNVNHLDRAVQRMEKKISSGADYFITQPVYDSNKMIQIKEATKHIKAPIYIGIMPLTSARNAEFLHNEVPGIRLTEQIRSAMANKAHDPEQSRQEGIAIAKELIDTALEHFNGIYLITPFLRYEMTVQLTNYIKEKSVSATEGMNVSGYTV
ncbi:bifunctional homocysteine S-methyltransferase/methylenetetrahydrofolate reductase [Bacillus aquiflavi]|uniref:bifunctional homocysteine S-methyltransferase/methylenetetrahydrofolate reductase n=1 Tax=Bacillus aquiflavi TaxID=2672567 RepID=UPI001CA7C1A2|nr:bifunctional homocysteine S-methyltransferase/methylenetetrahydrofolate reductase [Bacillus aquiflavi]UAC48442.1 bifunctional homocysteine S-methyltransferase/methylenetetrahydrofolate reductase [Bacillus aquiflavi]